MKETKKLTESYAIATRWTCDVFVVCAMMALPPLGGSWTDGKLGTVCVFTLIGAVIGFVGGIYYLLKLVNRKSI
jgi:hypothetical protein